MGNYITKDNLARFWEDCLSTFRMNGGQLLWENPSPGDDFSGQIISGLPDMSKYAYLILVYSDSRSGNVFKTLTFKYSLGRNNCALGFIDANRESNYRVLTFNSNTQITISDAYVGSSTNPVNSRLVPQLIYGTNDLGYIGNASALDAYPIGSIYLSVNSTSPASLFGGTWKALNSGNPINIPLTNIPVTTTNAGHAVSGNGMEMRFSVNGANPGKVGLGTNSDGTTCATNDASYTIYDVLEPTNLYAIIPNTLQAYMWKRTA